MKTESVEVKSQSEVVGTATYAVYDNTQEVLDGIGEEKMLELVNSQLKTNEMNTIRAEKTGKPSKTKLRSQALASIPSEILMAAVGNEFELDRLIDEAMAKLAAEQA